MSRPGGGDRNIRKKEEEERKQAKLAKLSNGAVFPVLPNSTPLHRLTGVTLDRSGHPYGACQDVFSAIKNNGLGGFTV